MKKLFLIFVFHTIIFAKIELSLEQKFNYPFYHDTFIDINTTESHKITFNPQTINFKGNFNGFIGAEVDYFNLQNNNSYYKYGIYIGSEYSKYINYEQSEQKINFNDIPQRNTNSTSKKLTLFDILTIEQQKYNSNNIEFANYITGGNDANTTTSVQRVYTKEIYKISTEGLYDKVKSYADKNEDFIYYWLAGSKRFNSGFKLYGLIIASYEHHQIRDGEASINVAGQKFFIQNLWRIPSAALPNGNTTHDDVHGEFKGIGYGYHLTAEYPLKSFILYLTSYYKKSSLKNNHTYVKNFTAPDSTQIQIIRSDKLDYTYFLTNIGIKYEF